MTTTTQATATTGSESCNSMRKGAMTDVMISTVGRNRNANRVWLEGNMLTRAGFLPKTRFQVEAKGGALVLTAQRNGFRQVSQRTRGEREIPIIDINSGELLSMFNGLEHVRVIFRQNEIHILPLASELRAKEREARALAKLASGEALTFGSLAHGGGVMDDAVEAGFQLEGLRGELAFANEIRNDLTEHAMALGRTFKPSTVALNGKMQELAFDEYVMRSIGRCDVLTAGLPCSGHSVSGRVRRGLARPEQHPEVGHLVVPFLAIIARVNPLAILLENVELYQSSASMDIIRSQLRDMHYELHETVLNGAEWGAMEHRKRMVLMAVSRGMAFDFDELGRPSFTPGTLADILENVPEDDPRWSVMEGLKAKEQRDSEAGKNFAMQIFNADSEKICTLTKGMTKNRSTDAKIQHPTNPELLRIPTAIEHARAKQIPEAMIAGLSATTAHELLGQSVIYQVFVSVGRLLAKSIKALAVPRVEPVFALVA